MVLPARTFKPKEAQKEAVPCVEVLILVLTLSVTVREASRQRLVVAEVAVLEGCFGGDADRGVVSEAFHQQIELLSVFPEEIAAMMH